MEPKTRRVVGAAALALGVALVGGGGFWALRPAPATPGGDGAAPAFSTVPPVESLARQYPSLESALNDPRLASVVKEFLTAYQTGGVEGARAFAKERGLLTARDELAFTVLFEGGDTSIFEAELKRSGGRVVARQEGQLDVALPWSALERGAAEGQSPEQIIGRLARITNVRGVLPLERTSRPDQAPAVNRAPAAAPATSRVEGVSVTHANLWHAAGFRGRGVKVGVLDPEVSRTAAYLGGALPASVPLFLGECVGPGNRPVDDEGTHGPAAAEIVHAMAPEAEIYVACSLGDRDVALDWLLRQGVKIISHSAGGMYGSRNGKDPFERRIDQLARQGILWVNAAGNSGQTFHHGQLTGGPDGYWHVFATGRQGLTFRANAEGALDITMLWSQEGTVSDYDLYLFDAQGREIARAADRSDWLRRPRENISFRGRPNTDYQLGVRGKGATRATNFVLDVHGASRVELADPTGSLNAPGDANGALTVGAAVWNTDAIAPYSSRGPTEDGRIKPDISAPTETMSTVYNGRFGGTSASTPHVAGAAALVWARYPTLSRDDLVRFLLSRAVDRGPPGPDNAFGVGRLDLGAPGDNAPPPTAQPPIAVAPPAPPPTTPPIIPTATPGRRDNDGPSVGSVLGALAVTGLGALLLVAGFLALIIDRLRGAMNRSPRLATPGGYGPPGAYGPAQGPSGGYASRGGPPQGQGPSGGYGPSRGSAGGYGPSGPAGGSGPAPQRQGQHLATPPQRAAQAPPRGAIGTPAPPSPQSPQGPRQPLASGGSLLRGVLVGVEGPLTGQTFTLRPGGDTFLGRAPSCDLVLPLSTVSSKHAKVTFAEDAYHIVDEKSANGTFVNGQRVTRQPLCSGDEIAVGGARFRFERRG